MPSFLYVLMDPFHRLMDPKKEGGFIVLGVYPLFLPISFWVDQKNSRTIHLCKTGVDIQTSMILQYENAQALLYCGVANKRQQRKDRRNKREILLHGFGIMPSPVDPVWRNNSRGFFFTGYRLCSRN